MAKTRKSGIHIKESHKGLLHKDLGVPEGEKIPASKLEAAKKNASPSEMKRITFAENAKKWSHTGQKKSKSTIKKY
jgi:hypothetical protein